MALGIWHVAERLRYSSHQVETIEAWLGRTLASGRVHGTPPAGVIEIAGRHRVEVLLADLLLRDRRATHGSFRESLNAIVRQAAARELPAARQLSVICDAARGAGIDLLLLKGAALAYTHYSKPWLRPRNDVDLFVRVADLARAEAVLVSLGYRREPEADAELWTGQRHYAKATAAASVHVDLHWRVANPLAFAHVLTFDEVWPRSVEVPTPGPIARTLSPPDALLLACVHRVAHHRDRVSLLWLWDIHLLASGLSDDGWRHFVDVAASSRMQAVCARGLALAGEYFGTALRGGAFEAAAASTGDPAEAFLREGMRPVDVARADLAALSDWRQKLALVREHLCPPMTYMRDRYSGCPRVLLPLAYVHRIIRGAPKWFVRT